MAVPRAAPRKWERNEGWEEEPAARVPGGRRRHARGWREHHAGRHAAGLQPHRGLGQQGREVAGVVPGKVPEELLDQKREFRGCGC